MIFGPLVSSSTSAVTVTAPSAAASEVTLSPSTRSSGCRLTLAPTASEVRSISRTSPTATLCWRPPLRTIAYTPDPLSVMSEVPQCTAADRIGRVAPLGFCGLDPQPARAYAHRGSRLLGHGGEGQTHPTRATPH